jgi:hypothetical protein
MDLNTFIVTVFCLIDDWLAEQPRYRRRGPEPTISDSEVLIIAVVGIWLGFATDKAIFCIFSAITVIGFLRHVGSTGRHSCGNRPICEH